MKCHQDKCENEACFRYTWPGKDETVICMQHASQIQGVGDAIGLPVQMIALPITSDNVDQHYRAMENKQTGRDEPA